MMLDALTANMQTALLGVFGLLGAASLLAVAGGRVMARDDAMELALRTRTWWIMATVLVVAAALGRPATLIFLAVLSYLALKEYLSLVPTRQADRPILLLVYAAIPVQAVLTAVTGPAAYLVFVPLTALCVLPVAMAARGVTAGFLQAVGTAQFGLMTTVYGLGHIAFLFALPAAGNPAGGSVGLAFFLVFLAQFNDVAQYACGKAIGGAKILPAVSPNKSWSGFLSGLGATTVLAIPLAVWLTPLSAVEGALAGAMIACAGFAGDIILSAIKRDLGRSDTGSMLPGHGGILDRVDSLILSAPLFFHFVAWLHYGGP